MRAGALVDNNGLLYSHMVAVSLEESGCSAANLWQACCDLLLHPHADRQEPVLGLRLARH